MKLNTIVILTAVQLTASRGLESAPGSLLGFLPSEAVGPDDLAHDDEDDTWWVTSGQDYLIYHYSRDLKEVLGTVPLPFDNGLLSFATGITVNTADGTLFVVDSFRGQIHETQKDGTATGRVLDAKHFGLQLIEGLAFFDGGDGGAPSLFLAIDRPGEIRELTLDGVLVRSFPLQAEVDRFFGSGTQIDMNDVDIILGPRGELAGFFALLHVAGFYSVARLDAEGKFAGAIVSLKEAASEVNGLAHRPFPHPVTGAEVDAFVCSTIVRSRFAIFEAGEPEFLGIRALTCSVAGRRATLNWLRGQVYDAIDVRDGCEILATLPGDASQWGGDIAVDGAHKLRVRGIAGGESSEAGPCLVVVGAGQVVRSAGDIPGIEDYSTRFLTASDDGTLIAANSESLYFFDLDLQLTGTSSISEFFLSSGQAPGGLAAGEAPGTLYLYNARTHAVGLLDYEGSLISSFDARLPPLDPRAPDDRGEVRGLARDSRGDAGRGSLWVLEGTRNNLFELDLSGQVLREVPHPYHAINRPSPGPFRSSGLSIAAGSEGRELYLSGDLGGPVGELFRFDVDRRVIVPGSAAPLDAAGFTRDHQHVVAGGRSRLFALTQETLIELAADPPAVAPPSYLFARPGTAVDQVELRFENNGPYDRIEVSRDCAVLAAAGGAAREYLDVGVPPGVREYAVRGLAGGVPSAWARASVRIGVGLILQRESTGSFQYPDQLARNPLDGMIFASQMRGITSRRTVARFTPDLKLIDTFELDHDFGSIVCLSVRLTPDGEPWVYYVLSRNHQGFLLIAETLAHEMVLERTMNPPSSANYRYPVGLTWDPQSDTFYYLETGSEVIVQMDVEGNTLRSFPNPAVPPSPLVFNTGLALATRRGTILTTTVTADDLQVPIVGCGGQCPTVSKVVELFPNGALTGYEIPLDRLELDVEGILVAGNEIIAISIRTPGIIFRVLAFLEDPPGEESPFIRGDANHDRRLDLSDAVSVLGYLFLGAERPPCLDSADINDSGRVDLSDPVHLLNHLFLGGPAPPGPRSACGADPTEDDLSCAAFPACG